MNIRTRLMLGLALAFAAAGPAAAQVSRTLTFGFDNPALMSLDINRNTVSFGLPPQYTAAPKEMTNAVLLVVKSNVPWVLTASVSGDFRALENAANVIASEKMEFRSRVLGPAAGVGEEYQPFLKNQSLPVARGGATPNEGISITTDYRLRIDLTDPAGTYSLPITYTLSPVQ